VPDSRAASGAAGGGAAATAMQPGLVPRRQLILLPAFSFGDFFSFLVLDGLSRLRVPLLLPPKVLQCTHSIYEPSSTREGRNVLSHLDGTVLVASYSDLGRLGCDKVDGELHCEGYSRGRGVRLLHLSSQLTGGAGKGMACLSYAFRIVYRHMFVRPGHSVSNPSACQRVQNDHACRGSIPPALGALRLGGGTTA
jgi:hypothetical protein